MDRKSSDKPISCPSAQPQMPGAEVFAVLTGATDPGARVGYLTETQPVTPDVIAAAAPAAPTEVMRIAAPCVGSGCAHFDGSNCRLATRVAQMLDPVVRALPRCAIRPTCRWFRQEGAAACVRCPQVITDTRSGTELQWEVAGGVARLPPGSLVKSTPEQ